MNAKFRRPAWLLALWLAGTSFGPLAGAADRLVWRMAQNRVDAEIENWDLPKLLEQISESTGWRILYEPDTRLKRPVSARFHNLSTAEALSRLLGDLNYAMVPGAGGVGQLMVFQTSRDGATRLIVPKPKKPVRAIPNELIVTLKKDGKDGIDAIASKVGAKVIGRADNLGAYRLQFADENSAKLAHDALADNASLGMVDYNFPVSSPPQPQSVTTSSAVPELTLKPGSGPDSSRTIIGLIDTQLQPVSGVYDQFLLPAVSVVGNSTTTDSGPSHGTSMLETLLKGVAQLQSDAGTSSVRVLPVDVYSSGETTSTFDVAKGIQAAIEGGASVINLSLGSPGDSELLHSIIQQGFQKGVAFVAAAGNEPTTTPTYPAAYPEVLAVTAGDPRTGQVANYANYGSFVDVIAPGNSLVTYNGMLYLVTGTSASTALVSGLVAGNSSATGQSPIKSAQSVMSVLGVSGKK